MIRLDNDMIGLDKDMMELYKDMIGLYKDMIGLYNDMIGLYKDMIGLHNGMSGLYTCIYDAMRWENMRTWTGVKDAMKIWMWTCIQDQMRCDGHMNVHMKLMQCGCVYGSLSSHWLVSSTRVALSHLIGSYHPHAWLSLISLARIIHTHGSLPSHWLV